MSLRPWRREEVERLVTWMGANQEKLRGKQIAWHKEVKEEEFADDDRITVKRISEKVGNMRRVWRDAKAMQARSGWGVRPEENEESINDVLERKCAFFWRLEKIWGSHPEESVVLITESVQRPVSQIPASQIPTEPGLQIPAEYASQIPAEYASHLLSEPASQKPSQPASGRAPPAIRSTPAPLLPPKHPEDYDLSAVLRQAFADKNTLQQELGLKRIQAEKEAKLEIARIQADAQVKQMEIFACLARDILAASRGGNQGGDVGRN